MEVSISLESPSSCWFWVSQDKQGYKDVYLAIGSVELKMNYTPENLLDLKSLGERLIKICDEGVGA